MVLLSSPLRAASDYELAPGDVLEFDFLDDDQLPVKLTVSSDGRIQVPLLGGVKIGGKFVSDVLEDLRQLFLDRNLLVDPKISLSVAAYRPIFVLGEVKSPGVFPFQPLLTVEQAIGLAGGPPSMLSNAEDKVVTQARLRGELDRISADLTRETFAAAQAAAKLRGAKSLTDDDLPAAPRSYLLNGLSGELKKLGNEILRIEQEAFDTKNALLTEGIREAEGQLQILDQLVANQKTTIQSSKDEIARSDTLFKKGLTVANEVAQLQRQLTSDEGRLLAIYSELSNARQRVNALRREQTQLDELRKKEALTSLQEHHVAIEKFLAERVAAEQQMFLVANLMTAEVGATREISLAYKVRRRVKDHLEEQSLESTSILSPGDVLFVSMKKPDTKASALQ